MLQANNWPTHGGWSHNEVKEMKQNCRINYWADLPRLLAAVWLAGGCSTPPTGHIYVNHPEVFTRERLVDRRLADLQWLESKLNQSVGFTLQGARSQSQFTGFAGQLSAQFDPLAAAGAVPVTNLAGHTTSLPEQTVS
jgi:hypothetical protein